MEDDTYHLFFSESSNGRPQPCRHAWLSDADRCCEQPSGSITAR